MRRAAVLLVLLLVGVLAPLAGAGPQPVHAASLAPMVYPFALTTGPDGAVWFTYAGDLTHSGGIGRLTVAGGLSQLSQPGNVVKEGIATDAAGGLWFPADSGIARMTTPAHAQTLNPGAPGPDVSRA